MKVLIGPSSFGQLDPEPVKLLERAGLELNEDPARLTQIREEDG